MQISRRARSSFVLARQSACISRGGTDKALINPPLPDLLGVGHSHKSEGKFSRFDSVLIPCPPPHGRQYSTRESTPKLETRTHPLSPRWFRGSRSGRAQRGERGRGKSSSLTIPLINPQKASEIPSFMTYDDDKSWPATTMSERD